MEPNNTKCYCYYCGWLVAAEGYDPAWDIEQGWVAERREDACDERCESGCVSDSVYGGQQED